MYGKAKSGSGETYEPPSYETKVACPKRYSSPTKRQVLPAVSEKREARRKVQNIPLLSKKLSEGIC